MKKPIVKREKLEPSITKKKKHWKHPFLNREPLEPSVPKQKNIGTTHF